MSKVIWQAVGVCVMALTVMAQADTLDVCPSGCTYDTIQGAIDAAVENDTIEIGPGTYFENLAIDGKTLTLVGLAGRDATIVDAQFDGRCLSIENVTGVTTISGITFQKGYFNQSVTGKGGGIYTDGVSTLRMSHSAVLKCQNYPQASEQALGGGIALLAPNSSLENIVIQGNIAARSSGGGEGGGVLIDSDAHSCSIRFCVIENNQVSNTDGTLTLGSALDIRGQYAVIENTFIRGNGTSSSYPTSVIDSSWPFVLNSSVICGNNSNEICCAFAGSNNLISDECDSESGPRGACCLDTGCVDVDNQYHCALLGGVFAGPYTMCNELDCDDENAMGACCLDGNCAFTLETVCTALGGAFQGAFVTCGTTSCTPPPPTGACCYGGNCASLTEETCLALLGQWQGADSPCEAIDCSIPPATGACCIGDGCVVVTLAECFAAPGYYAGDDTTCAELNCPAECLADLDGDLLVDLNDFTLFLINFGNSCDAPVRAAVTGAERALQRRQSVPVNMAPSRP